MSLSELHGQQIEAATNLENFDAKYKRTARERQSPEFMEAKLKTLDELWAQFEERDRLIRTTYSDQLDHEYFVDDLYASTEANYVAIREDIMTDIQNGKIKHCDDIPPIEPSTRNSITAAIEPASSRSIIAPASSRSIIAPHQESSTQNIELANLKLKQAKIIERVHGVLSHLLMDETPRSAHFYAMKLKSVELHWESVQGIHRQIVDNMLNIDPPAYDLDLYFETEEQVQNMMLEVQERFQSTSTAVPQTQSSFSNFVPQPREQGTRQCQLPKIPIPKFNGEYLKWRQFSDLFVELVHKQLIPPCQKMWYLKSSLTDEAESLIRHLPISNDNYDIAWKIISDRYDNKRLIISAMINKLMSQPIASTESSASLKALHDTTRECLLGLNSFGIDTSTWDPLLLHILIQRLHKTTHTLWEQSLKQPRSLPSLESFLNFIEIRFQSLEALGLKHIVPPAEKRHSSCSSMKALSTSIESTECISCKEQHPLFRCPKFLSLSPKERLNLIQQCKRCANCLRTGHRTMECKSGNCLKCNKKHNTLLHLSESMSISQAGTSSISHEVSLLATPTKPDRTAILSTILVNVADKSGALVECRALLDSGSQANFVTQRLARKLGLRRTVSSIGLEGIGQTTSHAAERVNILLCSKHSGYSTQMEAYILPTIVSDQPSKQINISSWCIPSNIKLADPTFHEPRKIDMLIGAGLFYSVLSVGQIRLGNYQPILQNTLFGWVVGGHYKVLDVDSSKLACGVSSINEEMLNSTIEKFWRFEECDQLDNNRLAVEHSIKLACGVSSMCEEPLNITIERFWKLEECDQLANNFTAAEQRVEDHFIQNTQRNHEGRFIVKLPFQGDPRNLGESKDIAHHRLRSIERKLMKDPEIKKQYIDFMRNFIDRGYMEPVDLDTIVGPHYFLPHHSVMKPTSTTTKLRVVFDASAKTSTNVSLNDILATGPTIQNDVFTTLLRFRLPLYAFAADVEQMYPQILVAPEDRKYLLLWWRENPDDKLKCFQLSTVTFGTTSAPYLATRCLLKLAEEEETTHPLGAQCLKRNVYVDDILAGANEIGVALKTQSQLCQILQKGRFHLRKWCANDPRLLNNIPIADQQIELNFNSPQPGEVNTMGLTWNPKSDIFTTRIAESGGNTNVSKRIACSDIARLFDPLGFFAPVVTSAKIFLRTLWKLKLDWDASLPQNLHTSWCDFRQELKLLENISMPRHLYGNQVTKDPQIHIFIDASENAYGAVAYIRSIDVNNAVIVRFVCAKSRVAPPKQEPIPRLELCAAKLGANLKRRIQKDLDFKDDQFHMWSDSTSVLGWINAECSNYYTFVANRISAIQQITNPKQWNYVNTSENPADIISRGLTPNKLVDNNFWFYGPIFLHGSDTRWTSKTPAAFEECHLELRQKRRTVLTTDMIINGHILDNINHKNSFRRLQRVMAYVLRFISRLRRNSQMEISSVSLTAVEMEQSLITIIKLLQKLEFSDELKQLEKYGTVDKHNALSSLAPFIDTESGILRVGGRLDSSLLNYDAKHPMFLPSNNTITKLLIGDLHKENLHAGPQALLSIVRQRFWPVKGKMIVRSVVKNCVKCTRANPKLLQQLMGNLPAERVQPARPFVNAGVDFLGPVWTHIKERGNRPLKSYVAVFCCFSSKAVHMELVSDLSTDAFLGALKRFMARRGQCRKLFCDNATNFVGANNQLQELQQVIHDDNARNKIIGECSKRCIEFSFIPPRAPHFGGLWEAAVKSAKHLLRTTISSASLTYEEMQTLLAEAEAILNSRPLTPMSNDPNDLTPLTPGHLLVGEPLVAPVDPHASPNNAGLLTRWKLIAHLKGEFWRRWTHEYLNQLQHRYKWKTACHNVEPGTMVIIKEDNRPPLQWSLGRIEKVIRGEDGLVRVADVRTDSNVVRRAIHRLAPLPMDDDVINPADEGRASSSEKRAHPSTSSHQQAHLKKSRR